VIEEEIDLRKYLVPILQRWRLILLTPLLLMVGTLFVLTFLRPPPFEAVATVAIVRWQTDVTLDPKIRTLSDQDLASATLYYRSDTRRNALAGLIHSGTLAQHVLAQIGDRLPPSENNLASLLAAVGGEVASNSDLLLIRARHHDPEIAALIATTWATEYTRYVNSIYSAKPALSEGVQAEFERTHQDYVNAQQRLETFISDSHIDSLTRQISMTEQLVNDMQQETVRTLSSAIEQRLKLRASLMEQYLNAQRIAASSAIGKEIETRAAILADNYAAQIELERLIQTTRAFRAQVAAGGDASTQSSQLALILLKAQIFTDRKNLPGTFQLALDQNGERPSVAGYLADLDGLLAVLEQRRVDLRADADRIRQELLSMQPLPTVLPQGDTPLQQAAAKQLDQLLDLDGLENLVPEAEKTALLTKIDAQATKLASMRGALEREEARERMLHEERDRAWDTYMTIARKQTEVAIADTLQGSEVQLADTAIVPNQRAFSVASRIVVAALMGLPLGFLLALAASLRAWLIAESGQPGRGAKSPRHVLPWHWREPARRTDEPTRLSRPGD
jgi:capsular polysaccharide biosynthesis protein